MSTGQTLMTHRLAKAAHYVMLLLLLVMVDIWAANGLGDARAQRPVGDCLFVSFLCRQSTRSTRGTAHTGGAETSNVSRGRDSRQNFCPAHRGCTGRRVSNSLAGAYIGDEAPTQQNSGPQRKRCIGYQFCDRRRRRRCIPTMHDRAHFPVVQRGVQPCQ